MVGVTIGTKGYMGMGFDGSVNKKDMWEYDPVGNTWTQKADFGGSQRGGVIFNSSDTKAYVGFGNDGSYKNDWWEYNPTSNDWTQKTSCPGNSRQSGTSFRIGNNIYITTGFNGSTEYKDLWCYNIDTDSWTQKTDFGGTARYSATAFSIGNYGYVGCGSDDLNWINNDFWEYNSLTDKWTQKNDFSGQDRRTGLGLSIGNKGYIIAGDGNPIQYLNDIWEYSQHNDTWTQKTNKLGVGVAAPSGFSINEKLYVGCGFNHLFSPNYRFDFYEYTPGTTPSVNTTIISNITTTTASSGGDVIFDGNYSVTARGVVWSTSANPTIASQPGGGISSNGTGDGTYTSSLTGLTAGTQYYYRAYTTNSQGTSYGEQYTFTTTQTGGTWARQTDFPITRSGGFSFSINNKGYLGGGYNNATYFNDLWEYDTETCQWSQKADFHDALTGCFAFVVADKAYVGNGSNSSSVETNLMYEYNPTTNLWSNRTNFPGSARQGSFSFEIDNIGYVGCGSDGTNYFNDFYSYNPTTNTWNSRANYTGGQTAYLASFAIMNKGYAGCGISQDGCTYRNTFFEYNPSNNSWTAKANFPSTTRAIPTGFSILNRGYIGLGYNASGCNHVAGVLYNDLYEYNPDLNSWTARTNFPGNTRAYALSFVVNNTAYVVGGGNWGSTTTYQDMYSYKPNSEPTLTTTAISSIATTSASSGGNVTADGGEAVTARGLVWSSTNNTPTISDYEGITSNGTGTGAFTQTINALCPGTTYYVRAYATNSIGTSYGAVQSFTTTASAGDIWVQKNDIGGSNSGGSVFHVNDKIYCVTNGGISVPSETWEFDYNANVWTQKVDFPGQGRSSMSGFVLNNKIYTGCGSNTSVQSDFYEYNPATNVWTAKASFPGAARTQAVGFAIGTKGYLGGGRTCCAPLTDYYEYDPTLNSWSAKASYPGTGVYSNVSFVIDNIAYVLTGQDIGAIYFAEFYSYNPLTNTWTSKTTFPGGSRSASSAFIIGQKAYIGFGYNGSYKNDLWEYDADNDMWIVQNNFSASARQSANAISIGEKVYIFGGYNGGSLSETYEYTPSTIPQFISGSVGSITNSGSVVSATYDANFNGCTTSAITQHGLVWHTATAPTTGTNTGIYNAGSGTSDITNYNISGLSANTTYYVRSFSTSAQGTRYGNERSFTTLAGMPTLSTSTISSISTTSASSGGNITNDGGTAVTARGLVWSASSNTPTTSSYDGITTNGTGTGAFTQTVNALCPGTTYYVRAYATNSVGTSYGSVQSFTTIASAGDVWVQKANFGGTGRVNAVAFTIGSKGYVGTGYDGSPKQDFWEYDINTNLWTQKANITGIRYQAVGFSIGTKGYIGTGYNDVSELNSFYEYDPTLNTWTAKANFGGGNRRIAFGFSINGKGYIGGGYDGSSQRQDMWEYDPNLNTWTVKANYGGGNGQGQQSFVIANKAYVGTGNINGVTYSKVIYEYNPSLNSWTQKSDYGGTAHSAGVAFSIGNKGYIGTGSTAGPNIDEFWEYDPNKNNWTQKANFGGGIRYSAFAFQTESKGYIGAGFNAGFLNTFYEYTPSTIPMFFSSEASNITQLTASISAEYDNNFNGCGDGSISDKGFVWDKNPNPTIGSNEGAISIGTGNSNFNYTIEDLNHSSTYYVRAYTTNAQGTVYGNEIEFVTLVPTAPVFGSLSSPAIGDDIVALSVELTSSGGIALSQSGFVYSTSPNPDVNNFPGGAKVNQSLSVGTNIYNLSGLEPETTYYIVSFAENSIGLTYSNTLTVTTKFASTDDDEDGIEDIVEIKGPNNGDGNGDGILDGLQPNIASFMFDANGNFVTVEATNCASLTNVRKSETRSDPEWYYPFGAVEFSVPCGQVEMKVYYHNVQLLTDYVYRKTNLAGEWGQYEGAIFGQESIGGKLVATVVFPLKDGEFGDSDGEVNGEIFDPGGPAIPVSANIPFWDWWWVGLTAISVLYLYKKFG